MSRTVPVARRYVYFSTLNACRGWPDEPPNAEAMGSDGPWIRQARALLSSVGTVAF